MGAGAPYVELHAHSAFSFLDGASTPMELAAAAAEHGYPAFALTDHDGIWGSMEFAHACAGFGVRAITGAELTVAVGPRALSRGEHVHLTLLVEDATGYRNLCRLLSAAHSHTRSSTGRTAGQPAMSLGAARRARRRVWCACRVVPATGRWRAFGRAATQPGRRLWPAACSPPSAASASGSSCSAPTGVTTAPATAGSPASPSGSASPCVATGDVHCPQPPPRPPPGRLRRGAAGDDAGGERAAAARQRVLGPGLAAGDGEALRRAPRGGRRDRARSPSGSASTSQTSSATATPAPRTPRRRLQAGRGLRGAAGRALRRPRPAAPRPRRRLEAELATIRRLGLSGFFLLHRDLLELAREVALEVRGPGVGAHRPAAGPGPRLQRQLDRLLPDRPLPRRPGRGRALRRPLPQRRSGGDARHRPRLPARHPRGADPARPRALRRRPLGPGRRLPHLPPARRGARPRQGAGAAAGGDRAGGEDGRLPRAQRRDRARRHRRDRRRARRARTAGGC